ncbi:carboxymuconolactone decarboxylase family protein [Streptomyces sp. NPDC101151]|uniref:carboxymuconolactone decarboxylase family protein n=1 Tax=Streptomyces sp. NPDC101151 TaxID=3366115 RepID=UPI0037F6A32D
MSPRMTNPSLVVPDALQPLLDLSKAINKVVPLQTLVLVHLRTSQINGREIVAGSTDDERLPKVATWRDETCFDDAERSALALAEAVTRLGDREDPVPDEIWEEAAKHYSEQELGALVIQIGLVNLWNRVNISTKQVPLNWP